MSKLYQNGSSMKASLRFISLVAYSVIGLGVLCNMIFYSTFGSGASSVIYALIGLLFDLAKIAFVGLFVYFIQRDDDQYFSIGAVCVVMWLALSALSLLASYGFLSQINEQYEMARLKETAIYAEHQAAAENAQAKVNRLAQYAKVDTAGIAAQIGSLKQANQTLFNSPANNSLGQPTGRTVGQMTADCSNRNWYTNHYCGQVTDNNALIQQLQAQSDAHQRYQAALAHYQAAQQAFSQLTVASTSNQTHPMFVNIGQLMNNPAGRIKNLYILLSSLVLELLASVLMFARYHVIFGVLDRRSNPINDEPNPKPIALPNQKGCQLRNDLLRQVKQDIAAGKLNRLSFRNLQRTYQISPSMAKSIRQALLREGIAEMDEVTHQLTRIRTNSKLIA